MLRTSLVRQSSTYPPAILRSQPRRLRQGVYSEMEAFKSDKDT